MRNLFLFWVLLMFSVSCRKVENHPDCHHFLTIINNESFTFYANWDCIYPDTLSFADRFPSPLLNPHRYEVPSGTTNTEAVRNVDNCLEVPINTDVICPSDTIMIYLFRKDSLEANPWENNPNLVLKRYDFTIEELNAINWTLIYP